MLAKALQKVCKIWGAVSKLPILGCPLLDGRQQAPV